MTRKWTLRLFGPDVGNVDDSANDGRADEGAPKRRIDGDVIAGSLLLFALLAPFWLIQVVVESPKKALDAFEYHYPSYLWIYSELAHGMLPLWNPYQLCGIPTLATLQPGVLYPPHILYLVLNTDLAMAISGLLHLALIGVAMLVLGLRLRLGLVPAVLAAVLVTLRGAQPGHILNPSMQEAGAWLGLGMLAVLDLTRGRSARGTLLLAIATAMSLLAGFPQFAVYSAYAWAFMLFTLLLLGRGPAEGTGSMRSSATARGGCWAVSCSLAAIVLGAALAAVQLLPALELSAVGGRERGLLPIDQMLPFGRAGFETPWRAMQSVLASRPALPGVSFSFGLVGLSLLPFALLDRARRTAVLAFGALGILTALIALGPSTPIFDLYLLLPEVGTFRNPWRILYVTDFCFAVIAAIGLQWLTQAAWGRAPHGTAARRRRPALVGLVVSSVALAEIFLATPNQSELPYDREHPLLSPYHQERDVLTRLAERPDRVWTWMLGDMGDVSEKIASVFGLRSISDTEIMTLRRQREYFSYLFWGELEPSARNRKGHTQSIFYGSYNILAPGVDVSALLERSRLVELAAARYLLAPRSAIATPAVNRYLREKGLTPMDASDRQIVLFEDRRALPRVYLTHHVAPAPPPLELLAILSDAGFDPRVTSYVEAAPDALPALEPASAAESVRIVRDEPQLVEVEARLSAPGLLVLADSFYPGWVAKVDEEEVPILATNHLFRGVAVSAGEHRVTFHYRPRSVRLGGVISLAAGVIVCILALRSRSEGRAETRRRVATRE